MAETINNNTQKYTANGLTSKNIKFLQGTQASLNEYFVGSGVVAKAGQATEGVFYLTNDTHRLYIGRALNDGSGNIIPVPVNEGIQTVASANSLSSVVANQGEFYYLEQENILAVRSGNTWVQLNSDTNDDTQVTAFSVTQDSTNNLQYNWTLTQTKKDKNGNNVTVQPTALTGSFTIAAADIQAAINVGVTSSVTNNVATISTTGDGSSNTNTVQITGGNGVTVSDNNGKISIASKTYTLGSPAVANATSVDTAAINLADNASGTSTVTINTGDCLDIDNSTADVITIKHGSALAPGSSPTYYGKQTYTEDGTTHIISVPSGGTLVVPKITKDAYGHINSISDQSIALPTAVTITGVGVDSTDKSKIQLTKSDSNTVTSDSVLFHKITVDGTENTVNNQGSLGTFYSATKVDQQIANAVKGINALVYRGTVGNQSSTLEGSVLPTTGVEIGDTYMVNANTSITTATGTTVAAKVGDLFIATGTEGSDGKITSATLGWTRVESGNVDTQYTLSTSTGSGAATVNLTNTINGNDVQSFILNPGTKIELNTVASNGVSTITFNHANSGVASSWGTDTTRSFGPSAASPISLNNQGSFVVPYMTVDKTGHVTAISDKTINLPDIHYTFGNTGSAGTGTASNTFTLYNAAGNSVGAVQFKAGNLLTLSTAASGQVEYNHATVALSNDSVTSSSANSGSATTISGAITVLTDLVRDNYGHVTKYVFSKYSLPTAAAYNLSSSVANNTVSNVMGRDGTNVGTVKYTSETLTFTSTSNTNTTAQLWEYDVELKWGSF